MSDIYLPLETTASVIKVDGLCYERVEESTNEVTPDISIESTHTDCEDCAGSAEPTSCAECPEPTAFGVTWVLLDDEGGSCTFGESEGNNIFYGNADGYTASPLPYNHPNHSDYNIYVRGPGSLCPQGTYYLDFCAGGDCPATVEVT